ncbi:MAG: cytochrome c oxidase assembly protein, partial [Curtobacterium sp.]
WTGVLVDNQAVRYLAQPFPAFLFLAAAWWAFFATDALRWSVSDSTGRTVIDVGFLLVGLLAVPTLLTPIAAGARLATMPAALVRIAGAVVVAAGLVSLGVAMRGPLGLLQASWFGAMGRTWGPDPLVDQARAGGLLVVAGVAVLVVVVMVVLVRVRRDGADPAPDGAGRADVPASAPAARLRPATGIAPEHTGAQRPHGGAVDVAPGGADSA